VAVGIFGRRDGRPVAAVGLLGVGDGMSDVTVDRLGLQMELTLAVFGEAIELVAAGPDGLIVQLVRSGAYVTLAGERATPTAPPVEAASDVVLDQPPFTLTTFGAKRRLAWPGGACAVRSHVRVASWDARYAALVDGSTITVIDARAGRQARLELRGELPWGGGTGLLVHDGMLAIQGGVQVVLVGLATLADVVAGTEREVVVDIRTVYPLRRPDAAVDAKVAWVLTEADAVVNVGTRQLRMHGELGLEHKMSLVLRDELWPGTFATVDVPGRPPHTLRVPDPPRTITARLVRGRAHDPAETGATLAPTTRLPELERLLAALARDPDDDATRGVLVDLLQELGEAYGAWVARERAGGVGPSRAHRRDALGPLAHFLEAVAYRGGLPWSAALARRPPEEAALVEAAAGDLRLGMLSELRLAKGPPAIYRKLVGSPRAIGLRHVDAPDRETLAALVAAGRDQLTSLHDVRFSKPAAVALLADPTFDRVVELETFVQAAHLDGLLARIAADAHGVFARAPRRLVLRARSSFEYALLAPALRRFRDLPLVALRVGAVSVRRDGDTLIARVASTAVPAAYWLAPLAEALPHLAAIELPDGDAQARAAVQHALPQTAIRPL